MSLSRSKQLLMAVCIAIFSIGAVDAAVAADNSRKDVLKKFDLTEDPGTDPDPAKVFLRAGQPYTIQKLEKDRALASEKPGWTRHFNMKSVDLEIYQEDAEYFWVFFPVTDFTPPEIRYTTTDTGKKIEIKAYRREAIAEFTTFRGEFIEVEPKRAGRNVRFREVTEGLPNDGSFRNAAAIGDMNGDGHLDIVAPPQRGLSSVPWILLGDGKGGFSTWMEASFPKNFNYGSASIGDLNGDGHADLVFGVHLTGVKAYLSDGKGFFEEASKGLPKDFPVRRAVLGDLDADGDLDIVAIFEGPSRVSMGVGSDSRDVVKLVAYLNDGTGAMWTRVEVNEAKRTWGGDWLGLANLNGDQYPDIVGSSVFIGARETIHLSDGPASWKPFGYLFLPLESYYSALTTGRFAGGETDDAIVAFQRHWKWNVDPELVPPPPSGSIAGIERISWTSTGEPVRVPIVQTFGGDLIKAMGSGDFDGDDNLDVVYLDRPNSKLRLLLGDGKGGFSASDTVGIAVPDRTAYDVSVDDLNEDGRPDLVLLFEAQEGKKNGSITVYLNEGVAEAD